MRILLPIAAFVALVTACGTPTPSIVFTSDRDGNLEIYSIDTSGGEAVNLTNSDENESHPVKSPDRNMVAFQAGSDKLLLPRAPWRAHEIEFTPVCG